MKDWRVPRVVAALVVASAAGLGAASPFALAEGAAVGNSLPAYDICEIATTRSNEVAPDRWTSGDRAFGYLSSSGQSTCSADCVKGRPDGYQDLVLQFSSKALAQTLGTVVEGDCVRLRLTAMLEDGITTISEDVVVTVRNVPKSRA